MTQYYPDFHNRILLSMYRKFRIIILEVSLIFCICCLLIFWKSLLNKSKKQHPTRQQTNGHLRPVSKSIQIRRTRPVRDSWRSEGELISDILQGTPSQTSRCFSSENLSTTALYRHKMWFSQTWWTIETSGGEESGKSVLAARHDVDDMME